MRAARTAEDRDPLLRRALLRWYRGSKRDLPWRRTHDPYAIWVAEIMLQQTRVAAVLPFYERFLSRFPDVERLAEASEEAVLAAWSGLGYYGRARALRRCARELMRRHAGRLPSEVDELVRLPGIGRYTAGAIASQAYGRKEPVLDGNVRRVLSRIFALRGSHGSERSLWRLAGRLVDVRSPGDWNQALMELGAVICTARSPRCGVCPAARLCSARALGTPEAFPPRRRPAPSTKVRVAVALVIRRGRVLLERPGTGNPLRGTWDLPAIAIGASDDAKAILESRLRRRGVRARAEQLVARASHSILTRRLGLEVYACRALTGPAARGRSLLWIAPAKLAETPVSGATRKVLRGMPEAP